MFGLKEGMYISAAFKVNQAPDVFNNVFLPLKILKEYKRFYTCEVQPHKSPYKSRFGISKPYIMTIDKFAVAKDQIKIRKYNPEAYYELIIWDSDK